MTNTKKILAIALAVILIASVFTACGNKDKPVASETTSNTVAEETTETTTEVTVPPIEGDETQTQAETTKSEGNSTRKDDKSSTKKATQTTKKATASNVKKPSSTKKPTTTKKPAKKPTTTKKPSNPTKNTYAYFTASTGEKIRYCTYSTLDGARSTGIHESNGKVTVTYDNGRTNEWFKCSNCGKYLCEGCQPQSNKCPYCGRTDCLHFTNGGKCPYCGATVGAESCHYCPNV